MFWKYAANLLENTHLQSNFIEIASRHGCSPVNLLHIFRTLFLETPLGGCFCSYHMALFRSPYALNFFLMLYWDFLIFHSLCHPSNSRWNCHCKRSNINNLAYLHIIYYNLSILKHQHSPLNKCNWQTQNYTSVYKLIWTDSDSLGFLKEKNITLNSSRKSLVGKSSRKLHICFHALKKALMENFIFS